MSKIYDLADYCANLISMIEFHEQIGTTKNPYLVYALGQAHDDLVTELKKEKEDGERKRHFEPVREGHASLSDRESELRRRYALQAAAVQSPNGSNSNHGNQRTGVTRRELGKQEPSGK